MITWSRHAKAVHRAVDIRNRWQRAETVLGPFIEILPKLFTVPLILFIVGLLDGLFSSALQLSLPPVAILVSGGFSLLSIASVAIILGLALLDGVINPGSSPFQTSFTHAIHDSLVSKSILLFSTAIAKMTEFLSLQAATPVNTSPPGSLFPREAEIYHAIVHSTYDDSALDQAVSALYNIIGSTKRSTPTSPYLYDIECKTLLHFLSPEASIRSNRTAAQAILRIEIDGPCVGNAHITMAMFLFRLLFCCRFICTEI